MTTDGDLQAKKSAAEIAKLEAETEAVREKSRWEAAKLEAETRDGDAGYLEPGDQWLHASSTTSPANLCHKARGIL